LHVRRRHLGANRVSVLRAGWQHEAIVQPFFKPIIMWIPAPIYKRLPVAYATAGVALVPAFGLTVPVAISAMALISAAAVSQFKRHQFKEENAEPLPGPRDGWVERRKRRLDAMRAQGLD
jgi:hypothetical protein